jgi:hypothetical protein
MSRIIPVIVTLSYDRWSEKNSINIAVLAELQRLLSVLEAHREWRMKPENADLPLIPFSTPVFDEHEQDLGQMDSHVIAMVVQFYGAVKFINSLQGQRSNYIEKGKSDEFDKQYLGTLNSILKRYKGQFKDMFRRYNLPKRVHKGAQS